MSGTGTRHEYRRPQLVSTTTNCEKSGYSDGMMPTSRSMTPKNKTAHHKATPIAAARDATARPRIPFPTVVAINAVSRRERPLPQPSGLCHRVHLG
jgi:hypothetical protein